jgi:glycosyltransferase involved in cell wall biosynthesis
VDGSPSIAVIVPAYNAEQFLERAVSSVFATGYQNVEVVIVDDGSKDSTLAVAKRICARFPGKCIVLQHPLGRNHGVSASRNLGVTQSNSDWLVFLDADDYFLPHRFEAWQRMVVSGSSAIDAIYELAEVGCDEVGHDIGLDQEVVVGNLFGLQNSLTGTSLFIEILHGYFCWQVSTVTLRRSLIAKTGLFDTNMRIAEDWHFWVRMVAIGSVIAGDLTRPVSVYWRHPNNNYRYELTHRIPMLKALLDAWRWAKDADVAESCLALFPDATFRYATRMIVVAREAGQPKIAARALILMAVSGKLGYLLGYEGLRQTWAVARELLKDLLVRQRDRADTNY